MRTVQQIIGVFTIVCYLRGIDGLQCPSCSHVTVTDVPGLTKNTVDRVLGLFSNDACSRALTGKTSEVQEETCAAPTGKKARCSWYKGTLTMKILVLGTEIPFHVSKRACYYAAAAAIPSNGCHDLENLNEDSSALKDIVDKLTSVLKVHTFRGQRCITNKTYDDPSSAVSHYSKQTVGVVLGSVLVMLIWKYL